MNRKSIRKILPLVMAAILAFSASAFTPGVARADVAGAAGPVGLSGTIAIGTASAAPTEVGFNGKLWQVIGYDGAGVASEPNDMTLLLKNGESYGTAQFSSTNYNYYDSTYGFLYLKMVDIYDTSPLGEKALIQARDIDAKDNGMGTETVQDQYFWPLSTSEAQAVNSTVREFSDYWWLRSPGISVFGGAMGVFDDGFVDPNGGDDTRNAFAVRPAFNLNLSSVLFTSGANAAGAAGLSGLAAYTAPTGALKFTALDSTFSGGFGITESAVSGAPGGTVTLNYTGAATGASHFIRVKLVNDATPGQIAYAAVPMSNITAAGGNFSLTLPAGMPMGTYTAYVWVEEGNGANLTNRGSVPDTFTLRVQPNVTFSPSPGSINLSNPTNLVFQADTPALLSGYAFNGVAFQNVTAGTGFGRTLDSGHGVTYNPATGALTVPAAAFGQHVSVGGGSPLTPGNYRARITFWDNASLYFDYYVDFVMTDVPAPTDASVNPATATFDKYAASVGYVDVPTTLTPGSYTLNSITLGGTTLTAGSHYTVSGNTYTFLRGYLATLGTGAQVFAFVMSGGANPTFTVTVSDSTPAPVDASINPITATFDKYAASAGYVDVPTTLTPGSYTLNSITLGGTTLTAGTHYTVSGGVYTFKKEYLATLGTGAQVFTFVMSGGANPTFTVTVSDSTPALTDASVSPTTAAFDKYAASAGYMDVPTTLTPGSYALSGITLGGNALTAGTHYTASGNVYTFKKEYLATLGTGAQAFTFVMSGGANPTFTVTVSDSTPAPVDASVSPSTATFDKYAASAGYVDVPTTLTPGSYALSGITLGGNALTAGTHYTASSGVYTFKKEYLAALGTGAQTFTFVMGGGANPTFTVTVSDSTPTTAASANVLGVTISGTVGSALGGGQRATITLTGDTVAGNLVNADASGWFTGLPAGITVTANASAGGSTITLTFGGTPTAASTQQFVITIPGSVLTGGNPISVAANSNARFSISSTPQPPSPLPKTGDGFPLVALMALLGAALVGMGWLGARLRRQKKRA